jgi:Class II flagellar assembly regulator
MVDRWRGRPRRQREAAMKITGSGPSAGTSQRRRVSNGAGDGASGSFAEHVGARAAGTTGIPPAMPLAALAGVLAVQEVEDPTAGRRRATRHGHSLLDELRELQLGMVEGLVSEGALQRLAGLVDGLRPSVADARLDAVLDAIELRAAVELAKLRRAAE